MWKFHTLVSLFTLINAFGNVDATPQRIRKQIGPIRNPETFVDIVTKNGYLADERFVTTEDGYVLSVHRIFAGPKSPPVPKKGLILMIHGMIASSDIWIMRGPQKDLAYLLVDEGFEVWALNVRGNTYSRRHIRVPPSSPEFWRFSWHENGIYDMSSTIDYMLAETGLSKVTIIGHSMGTTTAFVLLSKRPEYNDKVDLVVCLAPTAIFTRQFRGPLTLATRVGEEALNSLRRNGVYEVLPRTQFVQQVAADLCSRPENSNFCRMTLFLASGSSDREQFDDMLISLLLQHYPAGTSVDTVDHYRQNILSESFREFDFGFAENYARYGSPIPPEYPLWKITAPVLIYYGLNDIYVQVEDIRALEKRLPNIVASKVVPQKLFNHFDFVIARNAKELIYDDVIDYIKMYKSKGTRRFV